MGKRVKEKAYKINTIIRRNRFGGKDARYLHKVNSPKSFVIQVPVDPSTVSTNNVSTVPNIAYNIHAITQTSESLHFGFFNAKSINNKALLLKDFFVDQKLDLMALTETWTKSDSFKTTGELCPWGYGFFHVPGSGRQGGGVGLTARASAFENKKTQNSHHLSLWRFYYSHQNIV